MEEIAQLKGKLDNQEKECTSKANNLHEMIAKNDTFEHQIKELQKKLSVQEELKLLAQSENNQQ